MYTDESEYSGETDDGGSTLGKMSPTTRENFRQNVNVVVCLSAAVTLLTFNLIGAFIFVLAERGTGSTEPKSDGMSECLRNLSIGSVITVEMKIVVEKCLRNDSIIDDFGKALFFSWTLYSTVGYGSLYPHSPYGRFVTVVYSLVMIPIYIAFKFEFGTFLAHVLVVLSDRIGSSFRLLCNKIRNRLFARFPLNPDQPNSSIHRDHLIFFSSILLCTISLLSGSMMFSIIENISLSSSIYFGIITMSLIGLGDIVPTNLIWFGAYCLFFLISDVLSNQIFYFCQARIRFFLHCLARRFLLLKDDDNDFEEETTVSLQNVPVINTQCMPNLVMDCERNELNNDEKLLSSMSTLSKEHLLFS